MAGFLPLDCSSCEARGDTGPPDYELCPSCGGDGLVVRCRACGGRGWIDDPHDPIGENEVECEECHHGFVPWGEARLANRQVSS